MSIVSSTYVVGHEQTPGYAYVTETHTDNLGLRWSFVYWAALTGIDYAAILAARAVQLAAQLADDEAKAQLQGATLVLNYQTATEFAARFWARVRAKYQGGDKQEFARLVWWLLERITDGTITDAGARVTFNTAYSRSLTAAQWTTFKTGTLQPIHDRWAALLAQGDL